MNMSKRPVKKKDLRPYGAAIKKARTERKESRNKVGDEMFLSPRYLANIENKGQHPSVQIFLELMERYHVSVDQILFGEEADGKTTARRQLDALADDLNDTEIGIIMQRRGPFWTPERRGNNRVPGTTEQGMKDAMN